MWSVYLALSPPCIINHLRFVVAIQPSIILSIVPIWCNDWYRYSVQETAKSTYRGIKAQSNCKALLFDTDWTVQEDVQKDCAGSRGQAQGWGSWPPRAGVWAEKGTYQLPVHLFISIYLFISLLTIEPNNPLLILPLLSLYLPLSLSPYRLLVLCSPQGPRAEQMRTVWFSRTCFSLGPE